MKDFWMPQTKKEIINWLYWFYDGKYTRYSINKQNVKGWYVGLRKKEARKKVSD